MHRDCQVFIHVTEDVCKLTISRPV